MAVKGIERAKLGVRLAISLFLRGYGSDCLPRLQHFSRTEKLVYYVNWCYGFL